MSIISLTFLGFVALVFLGYFIIPIKLRPYVLLVANLCFYACFGLKSFAFLFATVLTSFFASLAMVRSSGAKKKCILFFAIAFNMGLLMIVKYLNFSLGLLFGLFDLQAPVFSILVPLGIAFYTMQAVSYCADVYRGKYEAETNFVRYLLYMSYFPIIMQGPISRYDQLAHQLTTAHKFSYDRMKSGLCLALYGLFKKMVIADRAALLVNQVFGNHASYEGLEIVIAALLYTVQIYADFSGCVDICRGVSEGLGIRLEDNFKHPYFAVSIKDFWRRWHCSLSSWFKDYIYIPLGGSRKGRLRKYANLTLVFLASGLWHGVGLQFIAWGLIHATYQIIGDLTATPRKKLYACCQTNTASFSFRLGQQIITVILVTFAWIFFRAPSLSVAFDMIGSTFKVYNPWILADGTFLKLGLDAKDWNVLFISLLVLLTVSVLQQHGSVRERLQKQTAWFRYLIYIAAVLTIVIFGIYGPGYDVSQFIYMQF